MSTLRRSQEVYANETPFNRVSGKGREPLQHLEKVFGAEPTVLERGDRLLRRLSPEQQRPIHHHVELRNRLRLVHQNFLAIGRNFVWGFGATNGSQGK